jgi:hypothetical protein
MIKIPYDTLGKLNFQQTAQKLANAPMKTPAAFAIKSITKSLREGFFKMRDEYKDEIESKFAVKENGKVLPPKEGSKAEEMKLPFACKEGAEGDVKGALDAFNKRELKIDRKKIAFELLFEVQEWSPRELEDLEPIITEPGDPA